jgi:carbon monoxide dehydrogenase subunit G
MELQGTHQFKAPLAKVWDALLDPTVLAKALPGGDQLERVGENDYKAAMNVRVGPVQGRFEGKVSLLDIVEHQSYRMKVSGTGAAGFLNGEGSLNLSENDEGTLLTYAGDVQIGGRIAAVGQRLIDSTAKSIIRTGLKALDDQILGVGDTASEPSAPVETEPSSEASPTPTRAPNDTLTTQAASTPTAARAETPTPAMGKMAVDVIKEITQDLASDYIPRDKQPQAFAFILGALAMLIFVILVRSVQRD